MSDIVEYYQQQAQKKLSAVRWLADIQSQALVNLAHLGFPTKDNEDWKYTSLSGLLQQFFPTPTPTSKANAVGWSGSEIPLKHQIIIKNGHVHGDREIAQQLPSGVVISPLSIAVDQYESLIKPYIDQIIRPEHGIHALNSAMLNEGLLVYVPKGVKISEPIGLIHFQEQSNQGVHLRHLIIAESGSEITVVEEYNGASGEAYLTNTITEIHVGEGAQVTHYKIQRESQSAYHLGHVFVNQQAYSQFASHSACLGGKLARSDISIYMLEEHAQCLMNGIYAPTDGQHMDHHTLVHHLVPHCRSGQDYKGILPGQSRAVFNGKVIVAKNAHHSDANQHNKNLLLSPSAEIDTKPQLEIFADDVICAHGATVGQLDEDALFYLATRGISKLEASHFLIQAFTNENIRLMPDNELANWISDLVTRQVG